LIAHLFVLRITMLFFRRGASSKQIRFFHILSE
jgi:hypothetical protein